MARKATTTTTRSRSRKPADAPKADSPKADAGSGEQQTEGRVVANKARPTRLGFLTSFRNTAEANGWTVTDLDNNGVVANGGHHLFHTTTTSDGGAMAVRGDLKVVASAFKVKDGSSNRMDAVYLWNTANPAQTQGKRIPTVYQALETLATGEAAAKDASRARGPKADKAEPQPAEDLSKLTKPQLIALAGERNIEVPKYGSKANLIEAISKASAAA